MVTVIIVHNVSPPLLKLTKTYDLTFDQRLVANNNDEPRCIQKAPFMVSSLQNPSVKREKSKYNRKNKLQFR